MSDAFTPKAAEFLRIRWKPKGGSSKPPNTVSAGLRWNWLRLGPRKRAAGERPASTNPPGYGKTFPTVTAMAVNTTVGIVADDTPDTRPSDPATAPSPATAPAAPSPSTIPTATQPVSVPVPSGADPQPGDDLRELIGVRSGLRRVDVQRVPAMSLRGFVQPHGMPPMALLEITDLKRVFLVQVGTEIPYTVSGKVYPLGRNELTGLAGVPSRAPAPPRPADEREQSQVILKVVKVSVEVVTVETGLMSQTIVVR